ncbi:MAG: hypothetical protein ACQEXJ_13550 [Myxococcota bacterium]
MAGSADSMRQRALLVGLIAALAVAGCGGGGGGDEAAVDAAPDALGDDATTDVPDDASQPRGRDLPQTGEGGAAPDGAAHDDGAAGGDAVLDAPADEGGGGDVVPDDGGPLDPEDLPSTVPAACDADIDCALRCAPGGTCVDGECAYTAAKGCVVPAEASSAWSCVAPGAVHDSGCLVCNPSERFTDWTSTLLRADLEDDADPFDDVQLLATPGASWGWSDARAGSGDGSLYFGDPGDQTYEVAGRARALVRGPAVDVPPEGGLELRFLVWLDTEQTPGFDVLRAFVVDVDTGERLDVWDSDPLGGSTGGVFLPVVADVDAGDAERVRVGFEFDSVDHLANGYEGAYVDRVVLATGCCAGHVDCDDGDACTTDTCAGLAGACEHGEVEGCCNADADCDDDDPCTVDVCSGPGGTCTAEPVEDCCIAAADCDDDDPCTEDVCPEPGASCAHQPLCCSVDEDCDDGDACTAGSCVQGQCFYESTCCETDAECNDGAFCTADRCVDGQCVHEMLGVAGCCISDILTESFDDGDPPGWTFTPKTSGVGWQVASVGDPPSPPSSLYYGDPAAGDFDSPSANKGSATSAPVELPHDAAITLRMQIYLDTESGLLRDIVDVAALTDGGEIPLVDKADLEQGEWTDVQVDLSYLQGRTIRLRFDFNTVDSLDNDGLGVLVDDLAVTTTCEPKACTSGGDCASADSCVSGSCEGGSCAWRDTCCDSDADCDDDMICTADSCAGGHCQHVSIPDCCEDPSDCDDGDPCTVDACSGFGGTCTHEILDGCCLSNADCDDGDGCTADQCVNHVCAHEDVCCGSDAECDDGDDVCTEDECVDGSCIYTPTGVEGCCDVQPVAWSFEQPVDFSFQSTSPPCGWQITLTDESSSGSHTLYYGDPSSVDYDCGVNSGTASSPVLELAEGAAYTLRFALLLDVETLFDVDQLFIRAVAADDSYDLVLWKKSDTKGGGWNDYQVDVSALGGTAFELVFEFDTLDAGANDGMGVFVDDVFIESSCAPVSCESDADCDDGLFATGDTCTPSGCIWNP